MIQDIFHMLLIDFNRKGDEVKSFFFIEVGGLKNDAHIYATLR